MTAQEKLIGLLNQLKGIVLPILQPIIEKITVFLQPLLQYLPDFPHKQTIIWVAVLTLLVFAVLIVLKVLFHLVSLAFFQDPNQRADKLLLRGKFDKAKKLYLRANNFYKVAQCCVRQGEILEAAKYFEIAKEFDLAAKYYAQEKEFIKAAKIFETSGRLIDAAEKYEQAGEFMASAEIYARLHYLKKAEEMYNIVHAYHKIAAMFVNEYAFEQKRPLDKVDQQSQEKRQVYLRDLNHKAGDYFMQADDFVNAAKNYLIGGHIQEAAQAYERHGNFNEAARLYSQCNLKREAAHCFEKAGNFEESFNRYRTLEDHESVARVLETFGRNKEAAEYRGILELRRGQKIEAAERFEQAGKLNEAATLMKELKNFKRAAALYEKANNFAAAADTYQSADDLAKAAECYERAQQFKSAAKCYAKLHQEEKYLEALSKAGAFLEAAGYLEKKDPERAIVLLQKIAAENPDYRAACHLLGRIFMHKGMETLANEMLERAVKDQPLDKNNIDHYYDLAFLRHRQQQHQEALKIFDNILSIDYHYKDALALRTDIDTLVQQAAQNLQKSPINLAARSSPGIMIDNNATVKTTEKLINQRYTIKKEVGRGGMGIVYQAWDNALERSVALKFLPNALGPDQDDLRKLLNEARSAARLSHPNIVTIYDIDVEQGSNSYFIVMEFIDGVNLKDIIGASHNIPFPAIHKICLQICEALAYAHQKNVVHRDIKTANILWTNDKIVKVTDFGLAKIVEESLAGSTKAQGSPVYMAPEQVLGHAVDARSDIYSLGISMYEMVTGKVPFERGDIGYHHLNTAPPLISDLRPETPAYLNTVISKAIAKKPEERYQSVSELKAALLAASPQ